MFYVFTVNLMLVELFIMLVHYFASNKICTFSVLCIYFLNDRSPRAFIYFVYYLLYIHYVFYPSSQMTEVVNVFI